MRYLIVSDIHANWQALEAVLKDAAGAYDSTLCCGDIVGYGADANRTTDWTRENVSVIVRGNHDKGAAGLEDLAWFNPVARQSALWTQAELTEVNRDYLERLPKGPLDVEDFRLVHGSPLDEDEYLMNDADVAGVAGYLGASVVFFGHSHIQRLYRIDRRMVSHQECVRKDERQRSIDLDPDSAYLLNPGSVGQPRDRDARAAYALYDSAQRVVTFCRAAYDIASAQARILEAGLPELLAERLAHGF